MTEKKYEIPDAFYDVHLHAYNLSHPGLLLFISRFLKRHNLNIKKLVSDAYFKLIWQFIGNKTIKKLFWITAVVVAIIVASLICPFRYSFHFTMLALFLVVLIIAIVKLVKLPKNDLKSTLNVFSIFENEEVMQFLYLELDYIKLNKPVEEKAKEYINISNSLDIAELQDYIRGVWESPEVNKGFKIGEKRFNKVIISPLVMDFSSKGFNELVDLPYNFPPKKTVVNQTIDLFRGIHQYYYYSKFQLMEIIPFLGLKPKDLEFNNIKKLLDTYFIDFSGSDSPQKRYEKIMKRKEDCFGEKIEKNVLLDRKKFYYAGIKVYPPLDVDPWPELDESELQKMKFIYKYCIDKRIPLITHCSDGGFKVMEKEKHNTFTSPARWKKALDYDNSEYRNAKLTLDFAHCGIQLNSKKSVRGWGEWLKIILGIIKDSDEYPNIYLDISDIGGKGKASYKNFIEAIKNFINELPENEKEDFVKVLNQRILFGTDHMVNLFHISSYKNHLRLFDADKLFENELALNKEAFYTTNPRQFLFG